MQPLHEEIEEIELPDIVVSLLSSPIISQEVVDPSDCAGKVFAPPSVHYLQSFTSVRTMQPQPVLHCRLSQVGRRFVYGRSVYGA